MKSVNLSVDVEAFHMCPSKGLAVGLAMPQVPGMGTGQDVELPKGAESSLVWL